MKDSVCNKGHRYFEIFRDFPIDQGGFGRHKCAGCSYEKGLQDGIDRKENLSIDLNSLPVSQAGNVRHKSPHAAYAKGYYDGVVKSYDC